jgi:molecular chaperone GrpE
MEDSQENDKKNESTNDTEQKITTDQSDEITKTKDKVNEQERLEAKLSEAYGKQDDMQNKYLRVHADLENIKKRAIREREDAVQRTRSQLISDLLPIIDSFKMGLSEASKHNEAKNYVEGFAMATNQLENLLNEYGLSVIEPTNQTFDPKFHEAISYEESEEIEEGVVIKTIREGYKLGEKLLRPASVVLSQKTKEENLI